MSLKKLTLPAHDSTTQVVPGELTWIYLAPLVTCTDRENFLLWFRAQTIFASFLSIFMLSICTDVRTHRSAANLPTSEADGCAVCAGDTETWRYSGCSLLRLQAFGPSEISAQHQGLGTKVGEGESPHTRKHLTEFSQVCQMAQHSLCKAAFRLKVNLN